MPSPAAQGTLALPVSEQRDHIRGPIDAPVTLVEYADFECPYCGQAHFTVNDLLNQFGDVVRLAYRHFPLAQIHLHAARAAEASEAAAAQGQFWQMHDVLFENQEALDDESLSEYAAQLGLDVEQFRGELLAGVHAPRVREDFMSGVRSGVNGTPTFLINGLRHDGPWDLESLSMAITAAVDGQPARKASSRGGRGHRG